MALGAAAGAMGAGEMAFVAHGVYAAGREAQYLRGFGNGDFLARMHDAHGLYGDGAVLGHAALGVDGQHLGLFAVAVGGRRFHIAGCESENTRLVSRLREMMLA